MCTHCHCCYCCFEEEKKTKRVYLYFANMNYMVSIHISIIRSLTFVLCFALCLLRFAQIFQQHTQLHIIFSWLILTCTKYITKSAHSWPYTIEIFNGRTQRSITFELNPFIGLFKCIHDSKEPMGNFCTAHESSVKNRAMYECDSTNCFRSSSSFIQEAIAASKTIYPKQ